jgi:hypothetical protein
MARKRVLDEEICSAGAVLHDVYVIVHGKYKDHARLAEPIARDLLRDAGFHDRGENDKIIQLIVNHSDKHIFSADPYIEFGKDVDVLDCFLYPDAVEYYLRHKPLAHMYHYLSRAQAVWRDVGVPSLPNFLTLLDGYQANWLNETIECSPSSLVKLLSSEATILTVPNFLLRVEGSLIQVSFNRAEAAAKKSILRDRGHDFGDLLSSKLASADALVEFFSARGISLSDCWGIMVWSAVGIFEPIPRNPSGLNRIRELTVS